MNITNKDGRESICISKGRKKILLMELEKIDSFYTTKVREQNLLEEEIGELYIIKNFLLNQKL